MSEIVQYLSALDGQLIMVTLFPETVADGIYLEVFFFILSPMLTSCVSTIPTLFTYFFGAGNR